MNSLVYQYWFLRNEDVSYGKKHRLIEYFFDSYHIYCANRGELLGSGLIDVKEVDTFIENRKNGTILMNIS